MQLLGTCHRDVSVFQRGRSNWEPAYFFLQAATIAIRGPLAIGRKETNKGISSSQGPLGCDGGFPNRNKADGKIAIFLDSYRKLR